MQLNIYYIGRKNKNFFEEPEALYVKRISHYTKVKCIAINPSKIPASLSKSEVQKLEEKLMMSKLEPNSEIILLDEGGKIYDSKSFSVFIEQKMNSGKKHVSFLFGGAYGFSYDMKKKYSTISLSKLTMPHHLARLVFVEQLYRAYSILNNEPYHNT